MPSVPAPQPTPDDRFDGLVRQVRRSHHIRVRRWRRDMTGCAWRDTLSDGTSVNWVEAPVPRTVLSLAIFLHEVGHHAIGFDRYRRRCEEEFHAWTWALDRMRTAGIEPDARTLRRVDLSMRYAVGKAVRRGIKTVPEPLQRFVGCAA